MDMLRLYARTLKVVEPIAEANQHKACIFLENSETCWNDFKLEKSALFPAFSGVC